MGAGHDHFHDTRAGNLRRLGWTLALVVLYMAAEVVGGILSNSLALLADAGHMLSDAGSLGLALFALWIARRPGTPARSFGYHRTEILAALANGATLVAVSIFIVVEAVERLQDPPAIDGGLMLLVAVGGLVVNLAGMWILHGGRDESLNIRGAWLHVVADTLGSVQVIAAGLLVTLFGWRWADPVASLLVAGLVVWSSWSLLREAVNVLMEATPRHIDSGEVSAAIAGIEGVEDVHDLHIWTITSGFEALSVHARVEGRDRDSVLAEIRTLVRERFSIEHSTVQVEGDDSCPDCRCG